MPPEMRCCLIKLSRTLTNFVAETICDTSMHIYVYMAENAEAWPLIVVMRLSEIKDPEFLSCRLQNGSTGVTSTSQTS